MSERRAKVVARRSPFPAESHALPREALEGSLYKVTVME
jgi:hypothetical protein